MNLLNEIKRMQELAGVTPEMHAFESYLLENKDKTLKELFSLLKEDIDNTTAEKAQDYVENMSDEELKQAAAVAKKLKRQPSVLNLTADQYGDKVANLAPSKEVAKTPLWKRITVGALALLLMANSLGITSKIANKIGGDKNRAEVEAQYNQTKKEFDKKTTAHFSGDGDEIDKAEKLNPTLDDPKDGNDVIHVQHDTGESNIDDEDDNQLDQFADDVTSVADKVDVKVNVTGNYSYQADDEANSNKANDGSQLDKSRAETVKASLKDKFTDKAEAKGFDVTDNGDSLKLTKNGKTHIIKLTSDTSPEHGEDNEVGDVDQSSIVSVDLEEPDTTDIDNILKMQKLDMNPGLPRMIPDNPDDVPNISSTEKTGTETGVERERPIVVSKANNPDVQRVADKLKNNTTLKTRFSTINNETELETLLLALIGTVNPTFQISTGGSLVNRGLTSASNLIKEANIPTDIQNIIKVINQDPALVKLLSNVNNEKEWTELLVRVIVPLLPPDFRQNKKAIKSAFFRARNKWQKIFIEWEKQNKSKTDKEKSDSQPIEDPKTVQTKKSYSPWVSTSTTGQSNIMYTLKEIKRLQKLAGIKK
jgi:hypothetical protein